MSIGRGDSLNIKPYVGTSPVRGVYLDTGLISGLPFEDLFTTPRAAGEVNGTDAESGPGTRTVVDTAGIMSIADGRLTVVGTASGWWNPRMYSSVSVARSECPWSHARVKSTGSTLVGTAGFVKNDGAMSALRMGRGNGIVEYSATVGTKTGMARWLDTIEYDVLVQARPVSGGFFYLNHGITPELVMVTSDGTDTPVRAGVVTENYADQGFTVDFLRLVTGIPAPQPLASDSFTRADGALGSTDGAAHQEANGGDGKAWTASVGTWAIASNLAVCSALGDGVGIATVDVGDDNVWVQARLHRSAGVVGLVARYVDADNYVRCYHDGTNIKVDDVVAGVTNNIFTDANAFVDGALLQFKLDGCFVNCYYNEAVIVGNDKASGVHVGENRVGIYTTDTGNSHEEFCVWSSRPAWDFPGMMSKRRVICLGDSITEAIHAYHNRLWKLLGSEYAVRPMAKGGQTSTQIRARFDRQVLQMQPEMMCLLCGVNDLWPYGDSSIQATVKANLQYMYSAARAVGITVVAITITPCKGHVSWSAAVQTNIDAINSWILTEAVDVDYRVDAYSALEDPENADTLLPAYDDGGHLHLLPAGGSAIGDAVYAVLTA